MILVPGIPPGVAAVFGLSMLAASAHGSFLLQDNFNTDATGSAPVNWTLSVPSGAGTIAVAAVPSATDKSVLVSKTSLANSISVNGLFTPTAGKVTIELKGMATSTGGYKNLPYIFSSTGARAVSVAFYNGNIAAYVGGTLTTVQTFTASTWYLIRVEMDTTTQTFNLYINGTRLLTNAAFREAATDIASLSCQVGANNTGAFYFDTVSVFVPAIPAVSGSYLVYEDFNSTATGGTPAHWTLNASGGSAAVSAFPFLGDKSLQLTKTIAANQSTATMAFSPISGQATFEIKARTEDANSYKNILTLTDGTNPGIQLGFNVGNIVSYVGGTMTNLVVSDVPNSPAAAGAGPGSPPASDALNYNLTPHQWYVIRVVLNTATGTYDLYLDGVRRLTGAAMVNAISNVSTAQCGITGSNLGTLYVDNFLAFTVGSMIGSPPTPVFDPLTYGAVADGTTVNTTAIQAAIDACTGSGGSVYLHGGTYLTGTLNLKSGMTFYVDRSATLLGSVNNADYPNQTLADPANFAPGGIDKALIFMAGATNVNITGGGTINGSGYNNPWWIQGSESTRPMLISANSCSDIGIQNIYLQDAGCWGLVPVETTYVMLRNILFNTRPYGNRDGFDITDSQHVMVENCTLNTEDDTICPKSGIPSGLSDVTVQNCYLMGSTVANGIKFGTASYGQFTGITFQDIYIKNMTKSGTSLECVDGAQISNVTFRRIEMYKVNAPIYVVIGRRESISTGYPARIGSVNNILYEDILGAYLGAATGNPVSGLSYGGVRYGLSNLTFRRVNLTYPGGVTTIPAEPPEMGTQYPECTDWGNLPAYAYFLRHADNVTFSGCSNGLATADARPSFFTDDVTNLIYAVPATASNLTVSKLEYDPAPPSASEQMAGFTNASSFQFVELMNVGTSYVDLSGVDFEAGASFVFTDGLPFEVIAPGQRVLLVSNLAAFQLRYGSSLPVAGVFTTGNLPTGGGLVQMFAQDGSTIDNFTFLNSSSWPTSTEGGGPALVLMRPAAGLNLSDPDNWRASSSANGSPGVDDRLLYAAWQTTAFSSGTAADTGPLADPDSDGFCNLIEYARGTDPTSFDQPLFPTVSIQPMTVNGGTLNYPVVSMRYRPAAENALLQVSESTDLQTWTTSDLVQAGLADQGDGTVIATYWSTVPLSQEPARFFRVNATYQP